MIPGVLASEKPSVRTWNPCRLGPGRNLFHASVDRQCQTRTRVLRNMLSSGHHVASCACACSHASITHVSHASGSDEGVIHELSWCGLPQFERLIHRHDARRLTCVWLAISNDISASMLVFPKYARFFTSNILMRDRAVPSATCRVGMTWC
jgi:hypothetical protein